jgi:hypothetical protein
MTTVIVSSVIVLFLWVFTMAIERVLDDKRCARCGTWDRARSMVKLDPSPGKSGKKSDEKFWHTDCFLLSHPGVDPPSPK